MVANINHSSVFLEASYMAMLQWIETEWKKYEPDKSEKLLVASVGNLNDLRKTQDVTRQISYPYVLFAFARIEPFLERGALARRYNQEYMRMPKASKAIVRNCIPVKLGFMLQFKTNNLQHVLRFSEMLINNLPGPTFYFEDEHGFRVECKANFDPSFDLPQADISAPGDSYTIEIPAYVTSYTGITFEQGLIKQIRIRYAATTGGADTTCLVDIKDGKVLQFEKFEINYTDIFDRESSYWKGK